MLPNFPVLIGAAFIPFIFGYIWFHPRVFGGENWKRIAGLTEEQSQKPVSPFKLFLTLILNFLLAFGLYNVCVHGAGVFGMVSADTEALTSGTAKAFLDEYAMNHASFGHGMIHGFAPALMTFVLPILGYVVIFEKKSTKYLFVYLGYWFISLTLMGGVIGQWGWQFA